QAIRVFLESRSSGAAKRSPASSIEIGESASGPAITERKKATSLTVRASGPSTLRLDQAMFVGQTGTRPGEGRKPTTLQKLAGLRSDPPRSPPSAMGSMRQASATTAPPLLPPQVFVVS